MVLDSRSDRLRRDLRLVLGLGRIYRESYRSPVLIDQIMNYSEPGRKGRHLALWQSLFQSATIIGGAINLGLNINQSQAGGLSPKTYLVFVALTCTAPLVAFFVTPPRKVQRVDGLPVPAFPSEGFFTEIWLTLRELRDPRILACE